MKHFYQIIVAFLSAICFALSATAEGGEAFEIVENFDDATHFVGESTIPEGWVSEGTIAFRRMRGSENGTSAYSGSYIFGTISNTASSSRDEKVFTPMMHLAGGRTCSISFYLYAPGGTPSFARNNKIVVNANTAQRDDATLLCCGETEKKAFEEWTPCTFTFTPEEDGDYCFELELQTTLASCGPIALDDFCISGTEAGSGTTTDPETPELEPDADNESEAMMPPYLESFDNENDNYFGDSYVPQHWFSTGSVPFVTANVTSLPAHTGTYYAIAAGDGNTSRDERLYTPFFMLEADKEYVLSAYVHIEKGLTDVTAALGITVGTQQESDFHITLLRVDKPTEEAWEPVSVRFTPRKSGAYCFSFAVECEDPMSGFIAIDDVLITAEGLVLKPKADFRISHIYDFSNGQMLVFPSQAIPLHNFSEYATEYEWTATGGTCTFSDPTAKEPTISFAQTGIYTIMLRARNSAGERTATQEVVVDYVDYDKGSFGISASAPDDVYYNRENLPAFTTDENDYITGPNHYYRRMAERLALGEGMTAEITMLNVILTHLNFKVKDNSREEQLAAKFSIVVYGERDGKLDESVVFGRFDSTLSEVFGTSGIGIGYGEPRNIVLPEPIIVNGPCYIAFEYGDDIDISIQDPNAGRTYAGFQAVKHASKCTTLMVCPTALPEAYEAETGEWTTVDRLNPELQGFGMWMLVWVNTGSIVGIALDTDGHMPLAARPTADGMDVSGTEEGDVVRIFSADGRLLAATIATGRTSHICLPQPLGGYLVVSTPKGAVKVLR